MIGILGGNGAGKSTILSAIQYAVTGDLTRLGGRQAVNILRSIERTAPPFVHLTFRPDGTKPLSATIARFPAFGAKLGSRTLLYPGDRYTTSDEVDRKFTEWTGLTPKLLSNFVFVEQGKVAEVVSAPPAERAKVLHRLFGIDAAAHAREASGDHLAGLPGDPGTEVLDALRVRAVEAASAHAQAASDLARMPPPRLPVVRDADQALVARHSRQQGWLADLARLEGRLAEVERILAAEGPPVPDYDKERDLFRMREQWRVCREYDGRTAEIQNKIKVVSSRLARVQEAPSAPPSPEVSPALAEGRRRRFAWEVLAAAASHDHTCPVCTGPLNPTEDTASKALKLLSALEVLEHDYAAAQEAVAAYNRTCAVQAETREREHQALHRFQTELAAHTAAEPARPPLSSGEVEAAIRARQQEQGAYNRAQSERRAAVADQAHLRLAIAQAKQELDPVVTDDKYNNALARLEADNTLDADNRVAKARLKALKEAHDSAADAVARAERVQAASEAVMGWRQVVEETRAVLHRDAAPADAAAGCLALIVGDINARLGHLAARFRVRVTEDGKIYADYKDGTTSTTIPAELLSGGEEAVLGLAWRFALLDRYAPRAELLCLDEPTHGLDRDRVVALRSALEAWRPHGSGRQVVVVTHDPNLLGAFDQVIDLR